MTVTPTTGRARTRVPPTWAETTLRRLGISPNATNVTALRLWHDAEGQNTPHTGFNWLNTSITYSGATTLPGNPDHVKIFPNYATGVDATAKSLKLPYYTGILRALATRSATRTGQVTKHALGKIFDAINASPWNGKWTSTPTRQKYPKAMYRYLNTGILPKGTSTTPHYHTGTGISQATKHKSATTRACACAWTGPLDFCILTKCQLRALYGGVLVVGGGILMIVGVALVMAAGLGRTGPLNAVRAVGRVRKPAPTPEPSTTAPAPAPAPEPAPAPRPRPAPQPRPRAPHTRPRPRPRVRS